MTETAARVTTTPVIETTFGKLRGVTDNGVHIFKGVPYAESTGGANRFLPPQPVHASAGVQDALTWSGSAPQFAVPEHTDPFYSWYSAIQPISEDCLRLNVFTPGLDDRVGVGVGVGERRPVMVWIHGGGWREFSGTAPGFDGTNLARAQDVVVVTVNHRLNGFGFLRLEGSDSRFADSGNAGLLDIVAALQWVRDNIVAFGGDANNVTIFGESGGASKIAAILAMRAAYGLFHKAILQSSGGGLRLADPEEAARAAASLASVLGLSRLDGAELQQIPMDTLVAAFKTAGGPFRGTIDGRSFDGDPFHETAPASSADVPVLAGCTNTETTYHLRWEAKNFSLTFDEVSPRLTRYFRNDSAQTDAIIAQYRAFYPDLDASNIMIMITSDFIFKRATYRIAALQAVSAQVPVYAFLWDRESPVEGGRMRSAHTTEVPFIFGTTDAARHAVGTGSDIEPMTRCMMATWAAFARTGNPNNPTLPVWKAYSDADRQTMVLDVESHLTVDPGGQARAALDVLPYFGYGYSFDAFCKD
jgi:para-nitrobenzyl esterase